MVILKYCRDKVKNGTCKRYHHSIRFLTVSKVHASIEEEDEKRRNKTNSSDGPKHTNVAVNVKIQAIVGGYILQASIQDDHDPR